MNTLSPRQQSILSYIYSEVDKKGYPPSVREICKAVGLASSSTVHGHLSRLEKKGYIRRDPTKPRAIELLKRDKDSQQIPHTAAMIPIVGRVTAGEPIMAIENIEDFYPVSRKMIGSNQGVFILTVRGNSMIKAGILDGDYIVVKQQEHAHDGDIVIATNPDGEATVKRFFKEADHIRLQPENDSMQPILVPNVRIQGKVIGIIRENVI